MAARGGHVGRHGGRALAPPVPGARPPRRGHQLAALHALPRPAGRHPRAGQPGGQPLLQALCGVGRLPPLLDRGLAGRAGTRAAAVLSPAHGGHLQPARGCPRVPRPACTRGGAVAGRFRVRPGRHESAGGAEAAAGQERRGSRAGGQSARGGSRALPARPGPRRGRDVHGSHAENAAPGHAGRVPGGLGRGAGVGGPIQQQHGGRPHRAREA
mmetsp:Transcript_39247/g.99470  ORF Transcript_39247/g.99470 Transcript_39247/m.99470 type:complete len:213 (+) Transcript_39247:1050-1688(+)